MPFVVCCALVYFWTLRFSRIGDFYTLRLGFFGNLDLRIIAVLKKRNKNAPVLQGHFYFFCVLFLLNVDAIQ